MGRSKMFLSNKEKFMKEYSDKKIPQNIDLYAISEELLENLEKEYKLSWVWLKCL